MTVGGVYGLVEGWRSSPSKKFKIRLNSVLNKTGRYSSRVGNAVGVLALMYSGIEWSVEQADVEEMIGLGGDHNELITPTLSAILTGILYKSTSGSPKAIIIAGGMGGAVALAAYGAKSLGIHSSKGLLMF
jgi:import inner membrane translocase subunit TIM23